MKRILVLSPHADDELLGCGGTLLKLKQQKDINIQLVLMSCFTSFMNHLQCEVTADERYREFIECSSYISTEKPIYLFPKRLEDVSSSKIITEIDYVIRYFKPTTIFIPEPSYHQDHQITYKCGIASCRPTFGHQSIKDIYLYEIPTSIWSGAENIYHPNIYSDITPFVDTKISIFQQIYKSQYSESLREKLSDKGIRSYANYRGIESNFDYAETFMLLKSTNHFGD